MSDETAKLRKYATEFCPNLVASLDDPETYFEEIGAEIQRSRESLIEQNRRPECGSRDLATEIMVDEIVREMYYPPPESEETETEMFSEEIFDLDPSEI